jgi:hypothetical protein
MDAPSSQTVSATAAPAPTPAEIKRGDRMMTGSIAFVAARCTLQYIVLPFVLPFLGIGGGMAAWLSLAIDVVALTTIVYNVRRLWHTSWRWRYLGLAAVMTCIIAFLMIQDLRLIFGF